MRKETILALVALGLGYLMLAQDLAALTVALPSIERDLNVDLTTAQWVLNAYMLVIGMLIVTGGRLADELGRRRVILAGGAIFAVTSLLAGLAPNASWLIGARALMGIGSGLMLPAILGMAYIVLPAQKAELASGAMIGTYGAGMALGPIAGGALTEFLSWRWIQFVNLPLAALVMLGVWRTVPDDAGGARPPIDYPGIVTLSTALVALLFALDQARDWGWGDRRIQFSLGLSVVAFVAFLAFERRAGDAALIPGDILRKPMVALTCVVRALMAPAYAASLLYAPQLMQKVLGLTPLQAGVGMLPMLGSYAVVSFLVASFSRPSTTRFEVIAGITALAIGPFLLSAFRADAGYGALAAGLLVTGIGLGLFQPANTTETVRADERGRKGLVIGLILMFQFVGGAVGLGLTTTIVTSSEHAAVDATLAGVAVALPATQRAALDGLLAGTESAQQVLQRFPPGVADELLAIAKEAFAAGVSAGLRLDAGIVAVAVVLAVLGLGGVRLSRHDPPGAGR